MGAVSLMGQLVGETIQHVRAQPVSKLRDPTTFKVLNTSMHRVDIPAKVTGGAAYVQDMRLPGMLHARVVRPPSYGAQLKVCGYRRNRQDAGRRQGDPRRQFPRRGGEARVPGDQGHADAGRSAEWDETPKLPIQGNRLLTSSSALPSRDLKILDQSSAPAALR